MFARFQGPGCLLKFFPYLGILVKGFYAQTRIITFTTLQGVFKVENKFDLKQPVCPAILLLLNIYFTLFNNVIYCNVVGF